MRIRPSFTDRLQHELTGLPPYPSDDIQDPVQQINKHPKKHEHPCYLQALADFEELLDNAVQNHSGPKAPQHWDFELRDQLNILRNGGNG